MLAEGSGPEQIAGIVVGVLFILATGWATISYIYNKSQVANKKLVRDTADEWWNERNQELIKQLDDLMARVELAQDAHTECERKLARAEGRLDALEKKV